MYEYWKLNRKSLSSIIFTPYERADVDSVQEFIDAAMAGKLGVDHSTFYVALLLKDLMRYA